MAKLLSAACVLLLLFTPSPQKDTFAKYKTVEAYEVRQGILMFPRYTEDGQVCEVGFERRHYSLEKITLYSTLSRQEIDTVVDELAPVSERGPKSDGPLNDLGVVHGPGMTATVEYENVTVQIYSAVTTDSKGKITTEDVAAAIERKNRKCK